MSVIWLGQYLCPQRHAIGAIPYRPEEYTPPQIEGIARVLLRQQGLNPWCGICGSRDLRWEHRPTHYTTWEEALPALRHEEAQQAITRAVIGGRY